jgi:peptidoglycan/LPS O-acetylase OafA/YrhL
VSDGVVARRRHGIEPHTRLLIQDGNSPKVEGVTESMADLAVGSRPASTAETGARGLRYLPGLDGVRALAVAAVVLFHAGLSWIPGGFLGVDVFFVLSGFLITSLLLREFASTGRIRFGAFYLRRARRLLPALFAMLAAVAIVSGFFFPDTAPGVRQDLPSALTYWSNWWYILQHQSYFAQLGPPPVLQHLWSLAVEEQFYLVWPLVTVAVLTAARYWRNAHGPGPHNRAALGVVAALGAIASTAWMAWLSVHGSLPDSVLNLGVSRMYFGTDTHAMSLLTGAALACVWRTEHLQSVLTGLGRRCVGILGIACMAGLIATFCLAQVNSTVLYRGGFLVFAIVAAGAIAAATCAGTVPARLLSVAPLLWLGQRSYAIYLWHWPIDEFTRPGVDVPVSGLVNLSLRLTLTVLLAELSYRFVETPVRRGDLGRAWKRYAGGAASWRARAAAAVGATALLATVLGTSAVSLASAPVASEASVLGPGIPTSLSATGNGAGPPTFAGGSPGPEWSGGPPWPVRSPASTMPPIATSMPPTASPSASADNAAPARTTAAQATTESRSVVAARISGTVTIIGDSVVLGASLGLWRDIPGAHIDASVGRQAAAVLSRLEELEADHAVAPIVVLHLGTNGIVTYAQLHQMLSILRTSKRVVVVNAHAPRPWQNYSDEVIAREVPLFPNAVMVNWNAAATGHPSYFVPDGVHLTTVGIQVFSALIANAIAGKS